MHYSDKAIEKQEEDELGRDTFAQELGRAILSLDTSDNFVIALNGEWGCGKTSILNMAIEEINEITKDKAHSDKPIVIWFNPWNYSDTTQLINQFFKKLSEGIGHNNNSAILKKIGKSIEEYSAALEFTEFLPLLGPISKLIKAFGSTVKDIAEASSDISRIKENIENDLKNQEQKIVIIIDDIDRLPNEQIRLIFQLVNSLAGFPNVRYLLSFDKGIVCNALKEVQKCDGEKYLEKIIQVVYEIPEISKAKLKKLLEEKTDKLCKMYQIPIASKDKNWEHIYFNAISPFISHIRDINRLLNSFQLKHALIGKETNFVDLLAITTIQLFAPKLYSWIHNHPASLTGEPSKQYTAQEDTDKHYNEYASSLKSYDIPDEYIDTYINTMRALFPAFEHSTSEIYIRDFIDNHTLHYESYIADKKKFYTYFSLSLDEIKYSKKFIIELCQNMPFEQVKEYFIQPQNPVDNDLLIEITANINKMTDERIYDFVKLLLPLNAESIHSLTECLFKLFSRVPEKIYLILSEFIRDCDEENILTFNEILRRIESSYHRYGIDYLGIEYRIITKGELDQLEKTYSGRLTKISPEFIWDNHQILNLWEKINPDEAKIYMKKALSKPINQIWYLSIINIYTLDGKRKYSFLRNDSANYISHQKLFVTLPKICKTDEFKSLPIDVKIIAASFYLWYEKKDKENNDELDFIPPSDAQNLLSKWEND